MNKIKKCSEISNGIYEIEFDKGELLTFSRDEVMEYGLYCEGDEVENLYELCTKILSKRMMADNASYVLFSSRTRFQVQKKFENYISEGNVSEEWAVYSDDAIIKALDRLEELKYLDDISYASKYASNALLSKNASKNSVINDLIYKKGISKEIAQTEVSKIFAENEQIEDQNIYNLLKKKIKGNFPSEPKEILKLQRYGMSRGFSYHQIENALEIIKKEAE